MTKRLVALVGVDIGDRRFEPGERIEGANERQHRYLVNEGYAEEVESGQRLPADHKKAIEAGAGNPSEIEAKVDTKEE